MRWLVLAVILGSCSVEKLPAIRLVHRGLAETPKRVVVLPTDCVAAEYVRSSVNPKAWCSAVDAMVASELAFRGIEVVDLAKLPARERRREVIEVVTITGGGSSERQQVTVEGPTYSDVDMWTQRRVLAELGIDALVRVRTARIEVWPVRTVAMVRVIRPADAALLDASLCELEISRFDGDVEGHERAVRCALQGLAP